MRRRLILPLCWALSSCVVGGFSISDQLPGSGAGGVGDAGSSSDGGTTGARAGASNGGNVNPTGGKAQGGEVTQAGSATLGGQAAGGAPTLPEGGGGAGGEGNEGPKAVPACANDEVGVPPIFCDDFEKTGLLDTQKWEQLAGIVAQTGPGPHGSTGLIHLDNVRLRAKLPVNLDLAAAGGGTTVSLWAKSTGPAGGANDVMWVDFGTATNPDVRLNEDGKGLFLRSVQNIRAPSVSTGAGLTLNAWHCVSVYLTASTTTVSYVRVDSATVTTFLVDGQATPNVDAEWVAQSPDIKTIATFISIGGEPVNPGDLYFDDVRIAHGKSNVCGL